jgi:hypothetical protein
MICLFRNNLNKHKIVHNFYFYLKTFIFLTSSGKFPSHEPTILNIPHIQFFLVVIKTTVIQ